MFKSTQWLLLTFVVVLAFALGMTLSQYTRLQTVYAQALPNIFPDDGKAGIGTTTPGTLNTVPYDAAGLHIKTGNTSGMAINGVNQADIIFNTSSQPVDSRIFQLTDQGGALQFRSLQDAGFLKSEILALTSGGKVGIGTTNPGTLNTVAYAAAGLHIKTGNTSGMAIDGVNQADIIFNTSGQPVDSRIFQLTDQGGALQFRSLQDAGFLKSEILALTSGGNVGVGTTSPSEKLEVVGNLKISGDIHSDGEICIGNCP